MSYQKFFKEAQKAKRKQDPQEVEASLRQVLKVKKRRRVPVPWKAVIGLVISLLAGVSYLLNPDSFENLLARVEVRALGMASAANEKTAEKSTPAKTASEKTAASANKESKAKSPEENASVSEEFSHFEKLKQRKEELDAREKELSELEEELQRQKVELDKRIQQLEEMRTQIAQVLKDRVEMDQEKVTKLVDLYSNMKPKQAADIIGSLNEDLAVDVLAKMKKKNAAEIMNLLPAEKARVLSEKYTGYKRQRSEPKG